MKLITRNRLPVWLLLLPGLLLIMLLALATGQYTLVPWLVIKALLSPLVNWADLPPDATVVVWNLRLPRIMAGLLVGGALAAAGTAYQGMFRNPLVSPDILGVSAGAGLGASLAILLGWSLPMVQLLAFIGGLVAVGAVYWVSGLVRRHDPVLVLVLAGVAVGTLLGAGISLIKVLADPSVQLPSITFWLLGGLNGVSKQDLLLALPLVLLGLLPMLLLSWRINLLALADDEAAALGVDVQRLRRILIVAATLMTAAAVSIAGIVGWVGLVIPHVARLLVGAEFSRLLPTSLILGAGFLVVADTLARSVATIELPLGILTALVGAPAFIWLLAGSGRGD